MHKPLVFHVQRFCVHDGPGIRSTVFFKGCPLHCLWCHNPESQRFEPELNFFADRCVGCGRCRSVCPAEAGACLACGRCASECPHEARSLIGEYHSPQALSQLLLRDRAFYDTSGGGVTLSGGEPMAQDMDYLPKLLKALKRRGIHISVDSCGLAPWEAFERLMPMVDLFLMDFKALDDGLHRRLTGRGNREILDNLKRLSGAGAAIWLRVPVVPGGNDGDMAAMARWAADHVKASQVNLLPYHRLGQDKTARLNAPPAHREFPVPDEAAMENVKQIWTHAGMAPVIIGG